MRRNEQLVTGEIYHIFNKSIAGYEIFNHEKDFLRMKGLMLYYSMENCSMPFSNFINLSSIYNFSEQIHELRELNPDQMQIIAYCIMPTHLHIIAKQLKDQGITRAMGNILNSYTKYFNLKRGRKGPLWVGPFRNVRVESDAQLLHLTRYIHLNPVTAGIVESPESWHASSYGQYISSKDHFNICNFKDILELEPLWYKRFVEDGIEYQKELARSKRFLLNDPISTINPRGS